MSAAPKPPADQASPEERLAYWKSVLEWTQTKNKDVSDRLRDRRDDLRQTKKKIKDLERALASLEINWNGNSSAVSRKIKQVAAAANAHGLVVTSTTGGVHSPTSWHYQGRAIDLAGTRSQMISFQKFAAKEWPNALEIFGPDGFYIKNGQRYGGAFPDHQDHVHIAR